MVRARQDLGTKTFTTAAPTTSATLVLAANPGRMNCIIANNGTGTVYLGDGGKRRDSQQHIGREDSRYRINRDPGGGYVLRHLP